MATKKLEGVALANKMMLKEIEDFLVEKKFYGKELSEEEQRKKAAFELTKRGALRKMLDEAEIFTKFDLAIERTTAQMKEFGPFSKIMDQYRKRVINKSFKHRKDECK